MKKISELVKEKGYKIELDKYSYWDNQKKIILDKEKNVFVWTVEESMVGNMIMLKERSFESIKCEIEYREELLQGYKHYKAERKKTNLKNEEEEINFCTQYASNNNLSEEYALDLEFIYKKDVK